jgi:hypothetical protein
VNVLPASEIPPADILRARSYLEGLRASSMLRLYKLDAL